MFGTGEGALVNGTGEGALVNGTGEGGAGPTCRDDSGGGLPAEENWGPRCIPPDPNVGGPLLAGPGVLEGGKIGPVVKGDDDPKGLRLG